jgi:hypothetical protein
MFPSPYPHSVFPTSQYMPTQTYRLVANNEVASSIGPMPFQFRSIPNSPAHNYSSPSIM